MVTSRETAHAVRTADALFGLRAAGVNTDVTFLVGGRRFDAHAVVLRAASPYFAALLNFHRDERGAPIAIGACDAEAFEATLEYLYRGATRAAPRTAAELVRAADMFGLDGLVERAAAIVDRSDAPSALAVLEAACRGESGAMRAAARECAALLARRESEEDMLVGRSEAVVEAIAERALALSVSERAFRALGRAVERWAGAAHLEHYAARRRAPPAPPVPCGRSAVEVRVEVPARLSRDGGDGGDGGDDGEDADGPCVVAALCGATYRVAARRRASGEAVVRVFRLEAADWVPSRYSVPHLVTFAADGAPRGRSLVCGDECVWLPLDATGATGATDVSVVLEADAILAVCTASAALAFDERADAAVRALDVEVLEWIFAEGFARDADAALLAIARCGSADKRDELMLDAYVANAARTMCVPRLLAAAAAEPSLLESEPFAEMLVTAVQPQHGAVRARVQQLVHGLIPTLRARSAGP